MKSSSIARGGSWFTLGVVVVAALAGCSEPSNRGIVRGKVLVDGKPAETGAVSFSPIDGKSPTAGGRIVNGQYEAEVPIGPAKVAIRVPKIIGERKLYDTPDSPVQPLMDEALPDKYNDATELVVDVQQGEMEHNFELSTR